MTWYLKGATEVSKIHGQDIMKDGEQVIIKKLLIKFSKKTSKQIKKTELDCYSSSVFFILNSLIINFFISL